MPSATRYYRMRSSLSVATLLCAASLSLAGCGEHAKLPESAGIGPHPALPPPNETLMPPTKIASAVGWPNRGHPPPAAGLAVSAFAQGLSHPRRLYVLPNGDVLVAETDSPPKP